MPASTPFLGLYKPGGGSTGLITPDEVVDIDRLNTNSDLIDAFAATITTRTAPLQTVAARLIKNTAQNTSATPLDNSFITFQADSASSGMWDAGQPTRATIPAGQSGLYLLWGRSRLDAVTNGYHILRFAVNGGDIGVSEDLAPGQSSGGGAYMRTLDIVQLTAGQYIELNIHSTTASTSIAPAHTMLIVKRIA